MTKEKMAEWEKTASTVPLIPEGDSWFDEPEEAQLVC